MLISDYIEYVVRYAAWPWGRKSTGTCGCFMSFPNTRLPNNADGRSCMNQEKVSIITIVSDKSRKNLFGECRHLVGHGVHKSVTPESSAESPL